MTKQLFSAIFTLVFLFTAINIFSQTSNQTLKRYFRGYEDNYYQKDTLENEIQDTNNVGYYFTATYNEEGLLLKVECFNQNGELDRFTNFFDQSFMFVEYEYNEENQLMKKSFYDVRFHYHDRDEGADFDDKRTKRLKEKQKQALDEPRVWFYYNYEYDEDGKLSKVEQYLMSEFIPEYDLLTYDGFEWDGDQISEKHQYNSEKILIRKYFYQDGQLVRMERYLDEDELAFYVVYTMSDNEKTMTIYNADDIQLKQEIVK